MHRVSVETLTTKNSKLSSYNKKSLTVDHGECSVKEVSCLCSIIFHFYRFCKRLEGITKSIMFAPTELLYLSSGNQQSLSQVVPFLPHSSIIIYRYR